VRPLFLVIPISAAVIIGLVVYRLNRPVTSIEPATPAAAVRPAPLFSLYDDQSQIVRLERYVGRHKLLVVFFDGTEGPDRSRLLLELRREFLPIHETKAIVLAVSMLRPSELRLPDDAQGERTRREEPFPFPMLADFDGDVHRRYGAFDDATGKPREAVFVVDRSGVIRHTHFGPDGLETPKFWADELSGVR
jgi:peroxiredoxin